MTSLKGKGCSFKRLVLGAPWDSAFTDCCTEAVSSSTQPTTLTKTSSISTSSTTTEVDELDYDDITDPTLNASSSGMHVTVNQVLISQIINSGVL